jgi:hypothetical protein
MLKHLDMKACRSSVSRFFHMRNPTYPPPSKKNSRDRPPTPNKQYALDYLVCGINVHGHKLLVTNDEGGKWRDLAPTVRTKSSKQKQKNHALFT